MNAIDMLLFFGLGFECSIWPLRRLDGQLIFIRSLYNVKYDILDHKLLFSKEESKYIVLNFEHFLCLKEVNIAENGHNHPSIFKRTLQNLHSGLITVNLCVVGVFIDLKLNQLQ